MSELNDNMDKSDRVFAHSSQQPSSGPQKPRPKSFFAKRGMVIAGVILLLVAGTAVAYFINREPDPSEVAHAMLINLSEVYSVSYDLAIESSNLESENEESITALLGGAWSWREGEQKGHHQLDIAITSESLRFFTGQSTASAKLDIRLMDEVAYFRIVELEPQTFVDSFIGQWISLSVSKQVETAQELTAGEKEFKNELKKAIQEERLLVIVGEFPDEEIGGVEAYHYEVAVNKEALLSILNEVEQSVAQSEVSDSERMEITQSIEDVRGQLKSDIPNFDIWIGKKDILPRRVSVDYAKNDFAGTVVLELSNFNNEISVIVPSESRVFEEVLEDALGEVFGGSALIQQ